MYKFMSEVGHHARIYPRYDSIYPYIEFLKRHFAMRHLIRRITLVGDALCLPEHGYAWTWEQLALNMLEDPCFSEEDQQVMVAVGKLHYPHARRDLRFIYTGIFRLMLTQALMMLPNLSEIIIGKLKPGEHIPGWQGDELMKQVSFYGHKGFNLSTMFYGDYQYDEIHQVANTYVDEYGMVVEPEEPGPQATFLDDFDAARTAAGIDLRIVRLHGYCSYYRLSKAFHRVVKYRCTCKFPQTCWWLQLTPLDAECSFCVERYDIEQDPFLDLDANLFKY